MCLSIGHDSQNTSKLLQTRKYYVTLPRQLPGFCLTDFARSVELARKE